MRRPPEGLGLGIREVVVEGIGSEAGLGAGGIARLESERRVPGVVGRDVPALGLLVTVACLGAPVCAGPWRWSIRRLKAMV